MYVCMYVCMYIDISRCSISRQVESGKRGRACTRCGNAVVPAMGETDAEGGQVAAQAALKRWTAFSLGLASRMSMSSL